MSSKAVLGLAVLIAVGWAAVDTFKYHSYWGDSTLSGDVDDAITKIDYMEGNQPIGVQVEKHWATLEGKVDTYNFKRDIGEKASHVAGVRGVTNNIEVLNVEALRKLHDLLISPPSNVPLSYVIQDHGTVVLSGPVADDELKQKIEDMVLAIRGVQRVENHLGENVGALVEQRIQDILRLHNIYFDFNKYSIRDDSRIALDAIAGVLKKYPDIRVRIEGHTDSIASDKYNLWLSQKRAESVLNALVERGVSGDRMQPKGFGESRPIASNETPEGRSENRRIEFKVTQEPAAR